MIDPPQTFEEWEEFFLRMMRVTAPENESKWWEVRGWPFAAFDAGKAAGNELAWAAGFFDGEGSATYNVQKSRRYFRLSIKQAHREPLERFQRAVGGGNIIGPYRGNSQWSNPQPLFIWHSNGKKRLKLLSFY